MRVSLDTHVLVSAYATRGLSADVYRHVLAGRELVLSETVLSEFSRVLTERLGLPRHHVESFIEDLRLHEVVESATADESLEIVRDADDRYVVADAIEGDCESLITGDLDILDVRDPIRGTRATSPREYWESIRAGK